MNKDNVVMSCLGILILLALLISLGVFMNGWALSTIWNWFVPNIFNLPYLTLWQAVGVSMVFEIFTGTNRTKKQELNVKNKSYTDVFVEGLILVIVNPVVSVFVAWVVLQLAS